MIAFVELTLHAALAVLWLDGRPEFGAVWATAVLLRLALTVYEARRADGYDALSVLALLASALPLFGPLSFWLTSLFKGRIVTFRSSFVDDLRVQHHAEAQYSAKLLKRQEAVGEADLSPGDRLRAVPASMRDQRQGADVVEQAWLIDRLFAETSYDGCQIIRHLATHGTQLERYHIQRQVIAALADLNRTVLAADKARLEGAEASTDQYEELSRYVEIVRLSLMPPPIAELYIRRAVGLADQLSAAVPENPDVTVACARAYVADKRFDQALEVLRRDPSTATEASWGRRLWHVEVNYLAGDLAAVKNAFADKSGPNLPRRFEGLARFWEVVQVHAR